MTTSYKVPNTFHCPECGKPMVYRYQVNLVLGRRPNDVQVCLHCGHEAMPEELIEQDMLRKGITPQRDWDDNL